MVRNLAGRLLAPLCAILLLSTGSALLADEAGKGGGHKAHAPAEGAGKGPIATLPHEGVYKTLLEKSEKEQVKIFNLANEDDRRELAQAFADNEVKEMEVYQENKLTRLQTDLGLWTLVVFLILLALLYKLAWGPMLTGLKKREESIAGALEASHKAQEEAKQMQLQLEKQMAEANQRVGALMEETRKAAARTQEEMLAKAQKDIAAERDRLRRELDQARDQALQDLSTYAAKLATDVAARVLQRDLNVADQHRLVEEALGEMRQAAVDRNRVLTGA